MTQTDFAPARLAGRDAARLQAYRELLDFYTGRQWPGRERRQERRLVFNYARVFVEKVTSYLMGGLAFTADPLVDTPAAREGARAAEEALARVAADNRLEQLDLETELDCAVLGDACYKVTWDPEVARVRVTAPDVQGLFAWWAGDDPSRVWRVASRYGLGAEEAALLHGLQPKGPRADIVEVWTAGEFRLYMDGLLADARPNPYGFIPFVVFPNLREPKMFWGVSDLLPIMESQRELNRAMSQLSRILELSGNPIAVLENVEESEDIAVKPGAVWNVPESARAYLLDLLQGGGVNLHISYINLLYRALHDLSESPRSAFGGLDRDLSGVALEIELQPLLQKVRRKRSIRTAAYNLRNGMILKLLQQYRGEDFGEVRLGVAWGPVLPRDLQNAVAAEQSMVQAGIHSRRTAMADVGVTDPDAEFDRWLRERESILTMNRDLGSRGRNGGRESAAAVPREDAGE